MVDEITNLFEDFQQDFRKHYFIIEPPWRLVMSNKGLLPLMKKLYPDSEHLLKTEFSLEPLKVSNSGPYVSKRFYGREGHSVLYSSDFDSEEEFLAESYKPMVGEFLIF
jgi:glutathionylspermidine synthase